MIQDPTGFGRLLNGGPGALVLVAEMVLWAYCAWASLQRRPMTWWVMLILSLLIGLSSILTFARTDIDQFYRAQGYSSRPYLSGQNCAETARRR